MNVADACAGRDGVGHEVRFGNQGLNVAGNLILSQKVIVCHFNSSIL